MSLIYLQTFILSFIQGVTEFIPISSSAHLLIFSEIFISYNNSVLFDASLHLGSLIAITHYFWKDLINISDNNRTLKLLVLGSLPLMIVGYFFYEYNIYNNLRNLEVIAWSTLIFGIMLYFSDKFITCLTAVASTPIVNASNKNSILSESSNATNRSNSSSNISSSFNCISLIISFCYL